MARLLSGSKTTPTLTERHVAKLKGKKEKTPRSSTTSREDDEEAITLHLRELEKEAKKKSYEDTDKQARLLSLTYARRRNDMMSQTANTRTSMAIQQFECLKKPLFVSCIELHHGLR